MSGKVATRMEMGGVEEDNEPDHTPNKRFLRDISECDRVVHVQYMYVRYLSEINTKAQTFSCAIGFDLVWEASEDEVAEWENDPAGFVPKYVPNFEFPNASSETKEMRAQENGNPFMIVEKPQGKYNFVRILEYLTCFERFELISFPFDVQELTVVMDMSFAEVKKAMFAPPLESYDEDGHPAAGSMLALNRAFCAIPEFHAKRVVVEFASRSAEGEEDNDNDAFRWSQVVIRFQLERRAEGFLGRIAFLSLLLAITSVASFTLDPVEERADRLGFLITLVLASVAFQYIVSNELPQVPYLVLLEKYTISVFTSTVVLLGLVSLLGGDFITSDEKERENLDRIFAIGFVAWLIFSQIVFVVYGFWTRTRERSKFKMGMRKLQRHNFKPSEDSQINVSGSGILKESKKVRKEPVNAFVSFAGHE